MVRKIEYKEIVSYKANDNKRVVVSSCSTGGYVVAQTRTNKEGKEMFLKGAFRFDDLNSLRNFAACIREVAGCEEYSEDRDCNDCNEEYPEYTDEQEGESW